MSDKFLETMTASVTGRHSDLRQVFDRPPGPDSRPLPLALAILPIVAGNDLEAAGYRRLTQHELNLVSRLFKLASTAAARLLYQAHPELTQELRNHPAVKQNLQEGLVSRLSPDEQAIRVTRNFLSDAVFGLDFQKRGLFDWDNGDTLGALIVYWAWQKIVHKKRAFLSHVAVNRHGSRAMLEIARGKHPQNTALSLIDHWYKLAWNSDRRVVAANSIAGLKQLAMGPGLDTREEAIRLLAHFSLVYAGQRFRDFELAMDYLNRIQSAWPQVAKTAPSLILTKSWVLSQTGRLPEARQLAVSILNLGDEVARVQVAQCLQRMGDPRPLEQITGPLPLEFSPRPNPNASRTLRLP